MSIGSKSSARNWHNRLRRVDARLRNAGSCCLARGARCFREHGLARLRSVTSNGGLCRAGRLCARVREAPPRVATRERMISPRFRYLVFVGAGCGVSQSRITALCKTRGKHLFFGKLVLTGRENATGRYFAVMAEGWNNRSVVHRVDIVRQPGCDDRARPYKHLRRHSAGRRPGLHYCSIDRSSPSSSTYAPVRGENGMNRAKYRWRTRPH